MPSASPPHCLVRRLRSSGSKQGCMFESLFCSGLWLNSSVSTTGYRTRAGKVEPSLSFELSERRRHLGLWNLSDCQLLEVPTQTDKHFSEASISCTMVSARKTSDRPLDTMPAKAQSFSSAFQTHENRFRLHCQLLDRGLVDHLEP